MEVPGEIGSGGNSGFQAVNVALQFGARDIALAGYDLACERGLHWHGPHPAGLNNPTAKTLAEWRQRLDDAAPALAALGARVCVVSPSALKNYPRRDLRDWLEDGNGSS